MAPTGLKDLPKPPSGKRGWPWTEESPPLAEAAPDGRTWPRISIVTPALDSADFIEETIRSVLLQGYPNLEYFIVDGGSSDGTVEIIRRYEPWLARWVSEADEGQSDAVNKGLEWADGQVLAYLNADDLYTPSALQTAGEAFMAETVNWLSGRGRLFGPGTGWGHLWPPRPWTHRWEWLVGNCLVQPSTFWRDTVTEEIGLFRTDLEVSMDYEYWLRMVAAGYELKWTSEVLSRFRIHSGSTTGAWEGEFRTENEEVQREYWDILTEPEKELAEEARQELMGRRYRWRAWRRAWAGTCAGSLADFWRAVRTHPSLLLSAKTLAVPFVALLRAPLSLLGRLGRRDRKE